MFDKFPELRNIPPGTPPRDGFLDGLFFIGGIFALIYIVPLLGLGLYFTGLPYAALLTGRLGLVVGVGGTIAWAVMVPGGLWFLGLPILAPAMLMCWLLIRASKERLFWLEKTADSGDAPSPT